MKVTKRQVHRVVAGVLATAMAVTAIALPSKTNAADSPTTDKQITSASASTLPASIPADNVENYSFVYGLSAEGYSADGPFANMANHSKYSANMSYDIPWIVSDFPSENYSPYPIEFMYYKQKNGDIIYCTDFNKASPTYGDGKSYALAKSEGFQKNASIPSDSTLMLAPLLYGAPGLSKDYYGITEAEFTWATSMGFKFVSGRAYDALSNAYSEKGLYWPDFISDESMAAGFTKIVQKADPSQTSLNISQCRTLAKSLTAGITGNRTFKGSVTYNSGITGYTGNTQHSGQIMGVILNIMLGADDIKADSGNFERNMTLNSATDAAEKFVGDNTLKGPYKINLTQGTKYSSANADSGDPAFTDSLLKDSVAISFDGAPANTIITDASGKAFTASSGKFIIPTNTDFYISSPTDVSNGKTFTVLASSTNVKAIENAYYVGKTSNGNDTQRMVPANAYFISGKFNVAFSAASGSIRIKKTDSESGAVLSGAVFTVYKDAACTGTPVGTITTDKSGVGSLNVPYGTYYVKETTAPSGHFLDSRILTFIVNSANEATATVQTVTNVPYGSLSVTKTDKISGQKLANAEFQLTSAKDVSYDGTIYKAGTAIGGTMKTTASGVVSWNKLPYGSYMLKETSAPNGYNTATYSEGITINSTSSNVSKVITNVPLGSIEITKIDSDSEETYLSGAEFSVSTVNAITYKGKAYAAGSVVAKLTTDANGKAALSELPLGKYTLTETKAPSGYVINQPDVITVTISSDSEKTLMQKITVKNKKEAKCQIIINKNDGGSKKLSGAQFTIYDAEHTKVEVITSDEEGIARSSELPLGVYYVQETKAPEGYVLDDKVNEVDFTIDGTAKGLITETLTISNAEMHTDDEDAFFVKVVKTDKDSQKPLAGAEFKIYDSNEKLLDTIVTGEDGTAESGYIAFVEDAKYTLIETEAPTGYKLDSTPIVFTADDIMNKKPLAVKEFTLTNEKIYGQIQIIKRDEETSEKLPDAVFELYDADNKKVAEAKTNTLGQAVFKELEPGSYTIKEKTAPIGYVLSDSTWEAIVEEDGSGPSIEITNKKAETPMGNIVITKVDDKTRDKLAGAEFIIKDNNGNEADKVTTEENGIATSKQLPYGKYTITEIKAPSGYVILSSSENIQVTIENASAEVTVENKKAETPLGQISVIKTDKATQSALAGAEFVIKDSNGDTVDTITTGRDGTAVSKQLSYGKYTITETKAPEYYVINIDTQTVILNSSQTSVSISNERITGELTIIKIDGDTNEKLSGAQFNLVDDSGSVVSVLTTDGYGKAYINDLDISKSYKIQEITAPAGYKLDDSTFAVEFKAKDKTTVTAEIEVKNLKEELPGKGKIELLKRDENGNVLEGAVFDILSEQGEVVDTLTTDSFGKASSKELPNGSYIVYEKKAPEGYLLDNTRYSVKIDGDGQILDIKTMTVLNQKVPEEPQSYGYIEIVKKDDNTGERIEGTVFEVFAAEDIYVKDTLTYRKNASVCRIKTDRNGIASTDRLPLGRYYAKEKAPADGYIASSEKINFSITEANYSEVQSKTIYNTPTKVIITKTDITTSAPVPGAKIEIYDKDKDAVFEGVTDSKGQITAFALPIGDYTFKETVAPDGYILNTAEFKFSIEDDGTINGNTTITNKPTEVVITKTDITTGQPLPGAVINIRDSFGKVVFSDVTASDGRIRAFKLPTGVYTFTETSAPDGYIKSSETFVFEIKKDGTIAGDCSITNKPTEVIITKKDLTSGQPLAGATISIRDSAGKEVFREVSGVNGEVKAMKLKPGVYTFSEISAPDGYSISTESFRFELKADGTVTGDHTITDIPTEVVITKKDLTTAKPLPGATIRIKDKSGQTVFEDITDSNGEIKVFKLLPGTYTFQEISAPDGYTLNTKKFKFELLEDGIVKGDCVIYDTPKEIIKTGVEAIPTGHAAYIPIGVAVIALLATAFVNRRK